MRHLALTLSLLFFYFIFSAGIVSANTIYTDAFGGRVKISNDCNAGFNPSTSDSTSLDNLVCTCKSARISGDGGTCSAEAVKNTTPNPSPLSAWEILDDSGIPGFKFEKAKLGDVLSSALLVVWYVATFLCFFWLVWGAFDYITSTGDKHKVSNAKQKIIYAVIGLLVTFSALLISQYIAQVLNLAGKTPVI